MKIIEAMKQIKDLQQKAADLQTKIYAHAADLDIETPPYPDQKAKVAEWLQSHGDILKQILKLRFNIQRTNIATPVTIELGGKEVTKTIAEWIHRRRDLAELERTAWERLSDRNLRPQSNMQQSNGQIKEVRLRRYYDPAERDAKVTLFKSEPLLIDAKLEVINAVTDLME